MGEKPKIVAVRDEYEKELAKIWDEETDGYKREKYGENYMAPKTEEPAKTVTEEPKPAEESKPEEEKTKEEIQAKPEETKTKEAEITEATEEEKKKEPSEEAKPAEEPKPAEEKPAEGKPRVKIVLEPLAGKPEGEGKPRIVRELEESASRDILPVRAEPETPREITREEAVEKAREIYEQKQRERMKSPFYRIKRFLGMA